MMVDPAKVLLAFLVLALICVGIYFILLNIIQIIWVLSTPLIKVMP